MRRQKTYTDQQIRELQAIINRHYANKRKQILDGDTSHNSHICMRTSTRNLLDLIKEHYKCTRQELFVKLLDRYTVKLVGETATELMEKQNKEGFESLYPTKSKKINASFCRHRTLDEGKGSTRAKAVPVAIRPSSKTILKHISFKLEKPITTIVEEIVAKEIKRLKINA